MVRSSRRTSPPLDASSVYVPTWSTLDPLNVATPFTAATVSVPPRVGPAGASDQRDGGTALGHDEPVVVEDRDASRPG